MFYYGSFATLESQAQEIVRNGHNYRQSHDHLVRRLEEAKTLDMKDRQDLYDMYEEKLYEKLKDTLKES